MTHDEISATVSAPRSSGVAFTAAFDGTGHKHGGGSTKGKSGSNVYLVAKKGQRAATLGFSEVTAQNAEGGYAAWLENLMKEMEERFA